MASSGPEVVFMWLDTYFKWLHHITFLPRKTQFLGTGPSLLHLCAPDWSCHVFINITLFPNLDQSLHFPKIFIDSEHTEGDTVSLLWPKQKMWILVFPYASSETWRAMKIIKLKCRQIALWDFQGGSSALPPLDLVIPDTQLLPSPCPCLVGQLCHDCTCW